MGLRNRSRRNPIAAHFRKTVWEWIMPNSLLDRAKQLFCCEEPEIQKHFDAMNPRPIYREMPRPHIGKLYEKPDYKGTRLPKVFVMAINQGRQEQDPAKVPQSLAIQFENGKYVNWYAPLGIAANFTRWVYAEAGGIPIDEIQPTDVHNRFAFDNCVKWAFPTRDSKPPPEAWKVFHPLNKKLIELLCPDIILAVGRQPYNALSAYGPPTDDKPSWTRTLHFCGNARIHIGRVYHCSYGPRLKHMEHLPKTVETAINKFTGHKHAPKEIKQTLDDINGKSWWSREYDYSQDYGEPAKFLGWHVCKCLARMWLQQQHRLD